MRNQVRVIAEYKFYTELAESTLFFPEKLRTIWSKTLLKFLKERSVFSHLWLSQHSPIRVLIKGMKFDGIVHFPNYSLYPDFSNVQLALGVSILHAKFGPVPPTVTTY